MRPDYYSWLRPLLFALDAETAHEWAMRALKIGLVPLFPVPDDPILHSHLWGRNFLNPIGLAAGFDKNAEVIDPCLAMGFGFVEVGTVTPNPQSGNPRPRVHRDPATGSLINKMGFPNKGLAAFVRNIRIARSDLDIIRSEGVIGVNIGMNRDQADPVKDYRTVFQALAGLADYLVVNVSSPNTPGVRDLQQEDRLRVLLQTLINDRRALAIERPPPMLVKLSPDMPDDQLTALAAMLMEIGIDGVILTNTTLDRPSVLTDDFRKRPGGLSGALLTDRTCAIVHRFYALTRGSVPIIAAGGIGSAKDAYRMIRAGASLVQLYTALVFQGPDIVRQIRLGLAECLRRDGFTSLRGAIGADHASSSSMNGETVFRHAV